MIYLKKTLCVIPARGGSKGIKDKNIIDLNGNPLISYTIKAAKNSKIFENIVVSTDSEKILEVSQRYGAEVPFLRPKELATDSSSSMDALIHAIDNCERIYKKNYDIVILLQPTSPLRNDKNIIEAFELFENNNANAVVSVCEVDHSPLWSNTLPKDLSMDRFLNEDVKNGRRQDLDTYYRLNGALYIADVEYIRKYRDWFKCNSFAYIMDKKNSIDIDDYFDLKFAEIILKGF
ncbi:MULTISPECIES: acylneuraminate cytidylyltransferase family protein [Oceanotoga]|uniref:acylneuraminate cytidylyltransferase family protein n=1 Tax=Oceanotoga TaxID=1255275 RepID=UPI0034E227CC